MSVHFVVEALLSLCYLKVRKSNVKQVWRKNPGHALGLDRDLNDEVYHKPYPFVMSHRQFGKVSQVLPALYILRPSLHTFLNCSSSENSINDVVATPYHRNWDGAMIYSLVSVWSRSRQAGWLLPMWSQADIMSCHWLKYLSSWHHQITLLCQVLMDNVANSRL